MNDRYHVDFSMERMFLSLIFILRLLNYSLKDKKFVFLYPDKSQSRYAAHNGVFLTVQFEINARFRFSSKKTYIISFESYIIDHYNPLARITNLFLKPLLLCALIFIHEWRYLLLKFNSELNRFLRNFSWHIYILSEFLPEIC